MTQTDTFRAFAIANLTEHVVLQEHREPWLTAPGIPAFESREAYKAWLASPDSRVPLFNLIEGENPALRVSKSNPAYRVWGVVADYDSTMSDVEVERGLKRIPASYPPFAWNRTRRGGVRIVWRFEKPVFYYGPDTYEKLMKRVKKELRLTGIFSGLDEDALLRIEQTYTAGNNWTVNAAAQIKAVTLELWLFDILGKCDDFEGRGVEVPLPVVEAEVHKRFPNRWRGAFELGSRGLRFWAPEADNETAAIVRSTGMTAFTGDRPFLTWADIFGREFVQAYLEDKRGRALDELWCDAQKNYYRQLPDERWDRMNTDQAKRHLKVKFGMSDAVVKGDPHSEIDAVLHQLELRKRVDGVLPFPHNPQRIVKWNGATYLNDSNCRLLMPALDEQDWGVNFPWIAGYVSTLMKDARNLEVLLAETSIWLKSLHRGEPARGHAVFLAGPPGTGKTLWTRQILARMVGGYAVATKFFTGDSRWSDALFDKALWVIDDSTPAEDPKSHERYSATVKAVVANPTFSYEKKHGYCGEAPFDGRLWVTLNTDSKSMSMLPDPEQSLLEKVTFLLTDEVEVDVAERESERYEIIDRELPFFMRWLLDMPLPSWLEPDRRFGFKAWQEPSLLAESRVNTASHTVMEVLDLWRKDLTFEDPKKTEWRGTTAELLGNVMAHSEMTRSVIGRMSVISFGRHLSNAERNGCPWLRSARSGPNGELERYVKKGCNP